MRHISTFVVLASILLSCSPIYQSGNSMYVTYENVLADRVGEAAGMADEHCSKFGKQAVPQVDTKADGLRTFECK